MTDRAAPNAVVELDLGHDDLVVFSLVLATILPEGSIIMQRLGCTNAT